MDNHNEYFTFDFVKNDGICVHGVRASTSVMPGMW